MLRDQGKAQWTKAVGGLSRYSVSTAEQSLDASRLQRGPIFLTPKKMGEKKGAPQAPAGLPSREDLLVDAL